MSDRVLPDSRMKDPKGCVMVEVTLPDAQLIEGRWVLRRKRHRIEMEPIFCPCGKSQGWVPRGMFSWVCFLCPECSLKHGEEAAKLPHSDDDFWRTVREEIEKAYGPLLTLEQLTRLAEHGGLTQALKLLERESPFHHLAR